MSKELFYGLLVLDEEYKINGIPVPVNEILTSFPLDQEMFEKNGTIVQTENRDVPVFGVKHQMFF